MNENLISTPSKKSKTPKQPESTLPFVSFDHNKDTVITLPKSGRTFIFNKNISSNKLSKLDEYLTKHNGNDLSKAAQPDLPLCSRHVIQYMELKEQYAPAPGRHLGIWTSKLDWTKVHDKYGFTNIITYFSGVAKALAAHFKRDSIMINLGYNFNTNYAQAAYNDIVINNPPFKYYYIDEPYQHWDHHGSEIAKIDSIINLTTLPGKLLFSDYYFPTLALCPSGDGSDIRNYFLSNPNTLIMCDQYTGNLCGNVHSFWNTYKAYYGMPIKNWTNWISLDHLNECGDLLNVASVWQTAGGAFNPVWVYGDDPDVNESFFQAFDNIAWQTGWLLRLEQYVTVLWVCPDGCSNCSMPTSNWNIYSINYSKQRWVKY